MNLAVVTEEATFPGTLRLTGCCMGCFINILCCTGHQQVGVCELSQESNGWVGTRTAVWGWLPILNSVALSYRAGGGDLKQVTAKITLRVANSISGDRKGNDKVNSEEFGMRPPMVAI